MLTSISIAILGIYIFLVFVANFREGQYGFESDFENFSMPTYLPNSQVSWSNPKAVEPTLSSFAIERSKTIGNKTMA